MTYTGQEEEKIDISSSFTEPQLKNKNCIYLRYITQIIWYMYTLWNDYHNQAK